MRGDRHCSRPSQRFYSLPPSSKSAPGLRAPGWLKKTGRNARSRATASSLVELSRRGRKPDGHIMKPAACVASPERRRAKSGSSPLMFCHRRIFRYRPRSNQTAPIKGDRHYTHQSRAKGIDRSWQTAQWTAGSDCWKIEQGMPAHDQNIGRYGFAARCDCRNDRSFGPENPYQGCDAVQSCGRASMRQVAGHELRGPVEMRHHTRIASRWGRSAVCGSTPAVRPTGALSAVLGRVCYLTPTFAASSSDPKLSVRLYKRNQSVRR